MTAALRKPPLQPGRCYLDRQMRRWRVTRVENAGRAAFGAALPALALVTCIEHDAHQDPDTRHPQWIESESWRWSSVYDTPLDLVSAA